MRNFFSLAILSLLTSVHIAWAQDRSCWYPNGEGAIQDTPCKANGVSVCCGQGFACLDNGICQVTNVATQDNPNLNSAIEYFRGSCTDQSWASSECPQFCIGSQYADDGGNSMSYCSPKTFCCLGGDCDCSTNFNVTNFDVDAAAFTTIGVAASSTSAAASTSSSPTTAQSSPAQTSAQTSSTSTAAAGSSASPTASGSASGSAAAAQASSSGSSSSSSGSSGLSTGAEAGIGVGVALGVIALLVLGFLFYRNRKQKRELATLREGRQQGYEPYKDTSKEGRQQGYETYGEMPDTSTQSYNMSQYSPQNGAPSELDHSSNTYSSSGMRPSGGMNELEGDSSTYRR